MCDLQHVLTQVNKIFNRACLYPALTTWSGVGAVHSSRGEAKRHKTDTRKSWSFSSQHHLSKSPPTSWLPEYSVPGQSFSGRPSPTPFQHLRSIQHMNCCSQGMCDVCTLTVFKIYRRGRSLRSRPEALLAEEAKSMGSCGQHKALWDPVSHVCALRIVSVLPFGALENHRSRGSRVG